MAVKTDPLILGMSHQNLASVAVFSYLELDGGCHSALFLEPLVGLPGALQVSGHGGSGGVGLA